MGTPYQQIRDTYGSPTPPRDVLARRARGAHVVAEQPALSRILGIALTQVRRQIDLLAQDGRRINVVDRASWESGRVGRAAMIGHAVDNDE